jgi:Na+/proline symporter
VGIGVSILLIAVGAVLAFAVHVSTSGFNLHTIGWILLIVGAVGALLSLIFWSSWGGYGAPAGRRREVVREDY